MHVSWLVKTEPSTYSYEDLERDGQTVWDGVSNNLALKHLRTMRPGDEVFVYHSGEVRAIVGLAEVVSEPYPDPKLNDPKRAVVDLRAKRKLAQPVSLAAIKAEPDLQDFDLVRISRLSVMPVEPEQYEKLMRLAETK